MINRMLFVGENGKRDWERKWTLINFLGALAAASIKLQVCFFPLLCLPSFGDVNVINIVNADAMLFCECSLASRPKLNLNKMFRWTKFQLEWAHGSHLVDSLKNAGVSSKCGERVHPSSSGVSG